MARINAAALKRLLLGNPGFVARAKNVSDEIIDLVVESTVDESVAFMRSHSISNEIDAGPRAFNLSGTLGGYGNLFSYIGFYADADPISDFEEAIRTSIKYKRDRRFKRDGTLLYKIFRLDPQHIAKQTPLPWERGRSWVLGISQGISGLGAYFFRRFGKRQEQISRFSRSGTAIQLRREIRGGTFVRKPYLSEITKHFDKQFKSNLRLFK